MNQTLDELYLDMPVETYHASPGVSNTMAKVFHGSPRDYWAQYIGMTVMREPTGAMDFGTVAHGMILQPDSLSQLALQIPRDALNAQGHKKGRAWTDFKATLNGRLAMKPSECDRLTKIHNAVFANDLANGFLQHDGHNEVSIFWDDILPRRSRLDRLAPPYVVDVKTTEQINRWVHTASEKEYYRQAAYYLHASTYIHGDVERFIFVVVQTVAPFHVRCFEYGQDDIIDTMGEINVDLHDLHRRIECDDWRDDRELGINEISIPRWKK